MFDTALAVAFVLMIIAPCVIALRSDARKSRLAASHKPRRSDHPTKEEAVAAVRAAHATRYHAQRAQPVDNHPHAEPRLDSPTAELPPPPQPLAPEAAPTPVAHTSEAERADAEVLLAQVAAAKAHAAALAAAAKAAAAKAQAAAELAAQTARVAAAAHAAALAERDLQARVTAQEHARNASGEHFLPETHPSLDFPRSGKPRRAA